MRAGESISIWFFIGISLAGNGLLILAAGLYGLSHPPDHPVVLSSLHADIWWGAILAAVGLVYSTYYRPGR
jgi:hypothetical protein